IRFGGGGGDDDSGTNSRYHEKEIAYL
ncbi:unnamed protein product, partial [Rotaria socialis]